MRWFPLVFLFLAGCGKDAILEDMREDLGVRGQAEALVLRPLPHLMFVRATLPEGVLGVCRTDTRPRVVAVNQKLWDSLYAEQRESTLAHEVGHCDRNLPHVEGKGRYAPACPDSLMHPDQMLRSCWTLFREKYLSEVR